MCPTLVLGKDDKEVEEDDDDGFKPEEKDADDDDDDGTKTTTKKKFDTQRVTVRAHQTGFKYEDEYESLADMWSEWHRQYLRATYPRILVRFEDTVLYAEELMRIISKCSGAPMMSNQFRYVAGEARDWAGGKKGSLLKSLSKLGQYDVSYRKLLADGTGKNREYLQSALDPELMRIFRYTPISAVNMSLVPELPSHLFLMRQQQQLPGASVSVLRDRVAQKRPKRVDASHYKNLRLTRKKAALA